MSNPQTTVFLLLVLYFAPLVFCQCRSGQGTLLAQAQMIPVENLEKVLTDDDCKEAFLAVRDRMSIRETFTHASGISSSEIPHLDTGDLVEQQRALCHGETYRRKVDDALRRAVKFYDTHLESLALPDHALALSFLKDVDSKHGGRILRQYPIDSLIDQICRGVTDMGICQGFVRSFESRNATAFSWKSLDILETAAADLKHIGYEKETAWTVLNKECMKAMFDRCEVPYVCHRVMFDPTPRSQYQLTHQLLHRTFADRTDCLTDKSRLVDPEVNTQLCAKMLKEAELLGRVEKVVGVTHLRDLFSEQTAFCGSVGYPNFFRRDFLENILSWQSKTDTGCFVADGSKRFVNNVAAIPRKLTKAEVDSGMSGLSGELCEPHLTSVSVMALAMYKDYMEHFCLH